MKARIHWLSWVGWVGLAIVALAIVYARGAAAAPPPVVPAAPSSLPEGWHHGAFAEIYVRGYRDSDGDGIGDLRGLTASLDYLQALGVRGLWLMPVTRSQDRDHGYAVADYRDIEPDYGTLADFDELLRQAHARGIGVIVDYVLNHSAAEHPAFVASRDPASPYRGWYVWREQAPTDWRIFGKSPWNTTPNGAYLSQFSPTMPDFDFRNPQVQRFHADNLRFWLDRGVDGFRFDAVVHLVENGPDAWRDQPEDLAIVATMRAVIDAYPNRYVVCEAASGEIRYASPDVCGNAFAIRHAQHFVAAARGDAGAIAAVRNFPRASPTAFATLLSNHDAYAGQRAWDQFDGDERAYRLAAAAYLLQPATPFIYYGEEIGLAGAPGLDGDPRLRIPMSWTADAATAGFTTGKPFRALAANVATHNVATQQDDQASLLAFYRALLALRNGRPSLARGDYAHEFVQGRVYGFQRRFGDERTLVLINYGDTAATLAIPGVGADAWLEPLVPSAPEGRADRGDQMLPIAARSLRVYSIRADAHAD